MRERGNPRETAASRSKTLFLSIEWLLIFVLMDYRYTMPQGFMDDSSVPVKWRLYGVVNGFWLSGRSCYGGNKYFAELLGVSERHIRRAFSELEVDKLLRRNVKGTSRVVVPYSLITVEADMGSPRGGHGESVDADTEGPHISDSIADRLNGAVATAPRVIVQEASWGGEGEGVPAPKKEKDANLDRSVKYWRELCKRETDLLPSTGIPTIKKILKNAHAHLTWPQIKQKMDEWFDVDGLQDHEKIQITRCFSTVQIDAFKAENV